MSDGIVLPYCLDRKSVGNLVRIYHQKMSKCDRNRVSIDLGASEIKCIYQLQGQSTPTAMTLSPNVIEVESSMVDEYRAIQKNIKLSSDISWLAPKKNAEKIWITDGLAEEFYPVPDFTKPKVDEGIHRIAATLGKIATGEEISSTPSSPIELELTILVPIKEYDPQQNAQFAKKLKSFLRRYYFLDRPLSIILKPSLKIYPEGLGGLLLDNKNETTELIIMLGHRNSSYLIFKNVAYTKGNSTILGFHTLLKYFCEKAIGQEENKATLLTLWSARNDVNQLKRLIKSHDDDYANNEHQRILAAYENSRSQLWLSIREWLKKELKELQFDNLNFMGGTSEFLKPLILNDNLFKNINPRFLGEIHQEKLLDNIRFLGGIQEDSQDNALRFVDVYGVFPK